MAKKTKHKARNGKNGKQGKNGKNVAGKKKVRVRRGAKNAVRRTTDRSKQRSVARKALEKARAQQLSELYPANGVDSAPVAGKIVDLDIGDVVPDPENPRSARPDDEKKIGEMAAGWVASGQQQAICVDPSVPGVKKGKYGIVFGHRRLAAAIVAGVKTIRAEVKEFPSAAARVAARAIENLDREDLGAIGAAESVMKVLDECQGDHTRAAFLLGRSEAWVRTNGYLARLSGKARKLVQEGRLSHAHAREIAKLADSNLRDEVAELAATTEEGCFGRGVEWVARWVREHMKSLRVVPWRLDMAFAGGPACLGCPHNTANDLKLFEDDARSKGNPGRGMDLDPGLDVVKMADGEEVKVGVCTNAACFERKEKKCEKDMLAFAPAAVKAVKKDEVPATAAGVGTMAPKFVKPATFARAVAKEVGGAVEERSEKSAERMKVKEVKADPRAVAEGKLEEAKHKRWDAILKHAVAAANGKPGAVGMLVLLREFGEWHKATSHGGATNMPPGLAGLLTRLGDTSSTGLFELGEVLAKRDKRIADDVLGDLAFNKPALEYAAVALGVEVEKEPVLAEFLGEEKPRDSAKVAKKRGKKSESNGSDGSDGSGGSGGKDLTNADAVFAGEGVVP